MWKITNISTGEEEKYYTQDELNSVCIQCKRELENYRLKKENEEFLKIANTGGALLVAESTKNKKYKQALEEIRKEANRLLYEENPIYGYNNSNYFELLAKYILVKIKEVLNDRD